MHNQAIIKEQEIITSPAYELAFDLCREGKPAEAKVFLQEILTSLATDETDEELSLLNLLAQAERSQKDYHEALRVHFRAAPLAERTSCLLLKTKFHNGLGETYRRIAEDYNRPEYLDSALIEYTAAAVYAEQVGDSERVGWLENNIAMVLCQLERCAEAHEHIARARAFARDEVKLAETDDTEAQILLKEERFYEAYLCAAKACAVFLERGEKRLLDEASRTLLSALTLYQDECRRAASQERGRG